MRKLELLRLELTEFKGCKDFDFSPNGKNADVFGDNGTFKTTLYDALCWLLFGKDSSFKSDFEIKSLNTDGSAKHNLCHEVKGLFRLDGKVIELKKVYSEIWTKKRGSASKEMTGHTTDHSIDSVPKSKREYQEYVSGIATEEQFKLLTSPFYFSEVMKPADRRASLMGLAGDITDADVIASNPDLAPLSEILKTRSIEDHKKVIAEQRKEINAQLEKIPVRIDEVVKGMPDVSDIIVIEEQDKIKDWSVELETAETTIAGLKNNGALLELQKDLATAETELIRASNVVAVKHEQDRRYVTATMQSKKARLSDMEATFLNNKNEIGRQKEAKVFLERNLQGLRDEWQEQISKDKAFQESLKTESLLCVMCGQNLPGDKVAEIVANHNKNLSKFKAENQAIGKAKAAQMKDIDAKIIALLSANEAIEKEKIPLTEEVSRLGASLQDPDNSVLALMLESSDPVKEAKEKKELIENRIQLEKEGVADDYKLLDQETCLLFLKEKIKESQGKIALVESAIKAQDRIKELEREQKTVAADFERLEGELFLIDEFTSAKVDMLDGSINGMFHMAKFRLFEEQINGGLSPCCKVTYNGVPFESSLNTGARINVGLDIINTISRAHKLSLPIVVDNAESVTELVSTEAQVIRLIVSEPDKTLRVEVK